MGLDEIEIEWRQSPGRASEFVRFAVLVLQA